MTPPIARNTPSTHTMISNAILQEKEAGILGSRSPEIQVLLSNIICQFLPVSSFKYCSFQF